MKNIQTKQLLKQLAENAKERLINGNYSPNLIFEEKQRLARENNIRILAQNQVKIYNVTYKQIDETESLDFIKKVEMILENESLTPLKELIDNEVFCKLNDEQKQRYIFDLSERYIRVKDNYEKRKVAHN